VDSRYRAEIRTRLAVGCRLVYEKKKVATEDGVEDIRYSKMGLGLPVASSIDGVLGSGCRPDWAKL
jgi:hypothetical protein